MYQFFHMSLYGRRPRKGAKTHETITGIAAEAARLPGACPHVKDPEEPALIYGVSRLDAAIVADERAQQARDVVGKRLRCDGAALAACVASYPLQTAKVKDDAEAMAAYLAWQGDLVAWLQAEFGGALMSVVAHWDEEYPHLHAYVVPELGPDLRLRWETFIPAAGRGRRRPRAARRRRRLIRPTWLRCETCRTASTTRSAATMVTYASAHAAAGSSAQSLSSTRRRERPRRRGKR